MVNLWGKKLGLKNLSDLPKGVGLGCEHSSSYHQSPLDLSTLPGQGRFGQTLCNVLFSDPTPSSSTPRLGQGQHSEFLSASLKHLYPEVLQEKPFVIRVKPIFPF